MNLLFAGNYHLDNRKLQELKQLGIHVYIMKEENSILPVEPKRIDGVVCNWLFVNHDIRQFTNLKYVQLLSAGLERMPMEYAREHNMQVYNARGVYSIPMAEFAVCGVLQLIKKSREFVMNQSQHIWEKQRDLGELSDKTVCVLGMGSVGSEVAKKFSVFCKQIIGVDIKEVPNRYFDKFYHIDMIDTALSEADIVVITLPLSEDTKYLFDKEMFSHMKESAILVNIARGKIIKERDLMEALDYGVIGGVVLDVFEEEPLETDSPIWEHSKIIVTPHNSFVSKQNDKRMWEIIISNLQKYIQGDKNGEE